MNFNLELIFKSVEDRCFVENNWQNEISVQLDFSNSFVISYGIQQPAFKSTEKSQLWRFSCEKKLSHF